MKGSVLTTRAWALLILAALLVAAGTLNFAQRLNKTPPPTDGVDWVESGPRNFIARSINPDSPVGRKGVFGIMPGDRLVAISLDEKTDEEIEKLSDIQADLEVAGVGGRVRYLIERPANPTETRYYHLYLDNLTPVPTWSSRDLYINLIGVIYLLVGLFVLFKQGPSAPFVRHFMALCLAAFVFHFYKPYGAYEDFDLFISFLDETALTFFAPLFLHFCALYPVRRRLSERHPRVVYLLYAPALALVALDALFLLPVVAPRFAFLSRLFPDDFSSRLWLAEVACLTLALAAGALLLVRRFWKSESAIVRQQLKWVVWGSALAVTPFTLFYAAGYLFGDAANIYVSETARRWLTGAAILPLALIPLTFGNSVVRYRLMDVDMVVRRTAVYALTTLAIALMLGTVVYVAGLYAFGGAVVTPGVISMRVIIAVVAMAIIVMTAAPLKNFLQEQTDRFFYGESYDLRHGLLDFGRTLSATTSLDPLLNALVAPAATGARRRAHRHLYRGRARPGGLSRRARTGVVERGDRPRGLPRYDSHARGGRGHRPRR